MYQKELVCANLMCFDLERSSGNPITMRTKSDTELEIFHAEDRMAWRRWLKTFLQDL